MLFDGDTISHICKKKQCHPIELCDEPHRSVLGLKTEKKSTEMYEMYGRTFTRQKSYCNVKLNTGEFALFRSSLNSFSAH